MSWIAESFTVEAVLIDGGAAVGRVMALGQLGRVADALEVADELQVVVGRSGQVGARFAAPAANVRAWVLRWAGTGEEADDVNASAFEATGGDPGLVAEAMAEGHYVALLDLADGVANLVTSWLPALDGVEAKLRAGASVVDIGCGYGASRRSSWPRPPRAAPSPASTTTPSRSRSPGRGHGRPGSRIGSASRRRPPATSPARDSTWRASSMLSTTWATQWAWPATSETLSRLTARSWWWSRWPARRWPTTPTFSGRLFYSAGMFICLGHAKAQGGRYELGPQVPESTWRQLLADPGFSRFRRATETPFNRVFEARP